MGIPDHLICLLGNLHVGQEATDRTGHGTTDWFQIGKGAQQGCILSPCLFNLHAGHIMRNADWINQKLKSRFLRCADDTSLMAYSEEELKAGLKINIQKMKIMASSPITSWQMDGGEVETVADFIFLGFKITVDSDCRNEMKRCLLPGRKAMTNLDNVLKSRDLTSLTSQYSQSYGFSSSPVQMWELDHKEGWVVKNWCFQIRVPVKTLESLLGCKEIKPINPKRNQPWIVLSKGLMLKLQYFWPPDVKSWLIRKHPDAGKDWKQKE